MSQQLRVLVAFAGDPSSVPSTHTGARVQIHMHFIKNEINVNFFVLNTYSPPTIIISQISQ